MSRVMDAGPTARSLMRVPGGCASRGKTHYAEDRYRRPSADAPAAFRQDAENALHSNVAGSFIAEWDIIRQPGGLGVSLPVAPGRIGALKVVTTGCGRVIAEERRPYATPPWSRILRSLVRVRQRVDTVVTVVDDPRYLNQPFSHEHHFKREPTGRMDAFAVRF